MMRKLPITVVIPTKNEEKNLARCLENVRYFEEVIVVDSSSTDRTAEIARSYNVKLINFIWNGKYPKKRNWVLINHTPETPWVLFLDADEVIDERFCKSVSDAIESGGCDAFWISYTNYFLGQKLSYGVPQRKLALFKVGTALYERIDEERWSSLDMEVHEHPIVSGRVGTIGEPIEHHDFRGLANFLERHQNYAAWEARRLLMLRGNATFASHLTRRQLIKYSCLDRWWYPFAYFFYSYLVKLGFLDGAAGFYYAFYKAWYFLSIRLILHEYPSKAGKSKQGLN